MKFFSFRRLIFTLFAAFLATSAVFAQDVTATIQGSILDPAGAAVPDAKITITNTDRQEVVRTIVTGPNGNYSAPLLPIGHYDLKVEAKGFKAATRTGIVLNVNDNLKLNIPLEVGEVSQTVEVREQQAVVDLTTPANATTIEGVQVRELSLATRNYEQLASLMPGVTAAATDQLYIGVSSPAGTAATIPYSFDGNRNSANNWTVDGADNVDRGSNLTLITFPSVDSIAEFKVQRGLYTADTGRAGGAQINVITRSGTSEFHGDLYEFVRNNDFSANNWINNADRVNVVNGKAQVPALRWNDFGGTIGGPVYIPGHYNKDKNKTFFFFSEEARRIHTYTNFNPTLPTQAMLTGNFSAPVCVSYTTACQASATSIPASQINPIAAEYIKDIFSKLPLPAVNSVAAQSAAFFPVQNIYNSRQEIVRIDHAFSEKFSMWGKFENDSIPTVEPGGLFTGAAIPGLATTDTNAPGRVLAIHGVNVITPTILNDAAFNYSQSAINSTPAGLMNKSNNPDINVPEPFTNTQGVVPEVTFSGFTSAGLLGYGPYNEYNKNFNGYDNFTVIKGAHTMRFGITFNRYDKTENAANQEGAFAFSTIGNPGGTANNFNQDFANFLLGNVATFSMPSSDITPDLWATQTELWAQDDYRVTTHLTVYAGVRYSYFGQPVDTHNMLDNFDPALYNPANAPQINPANGNIVPGTGNNPSLNGIIIGGRNSPFGKMVGNTEWLNFAPRAGIAWDPFGDGKTSVRAGYGIYYDSGLFGTYEQNTFANPPFVQSVTYSNAPFNNITQGTVGVSAAPLSLHATEIPALIPYVQQWSFDIQRQLPSNAIVDIGYVGSKGTHLIGEVDINEPYPGTALTAGLHAANGSTIFTTADDPRINAVRPYLGFGPITAIESAFDSNYNSLQVSIKKSFGAAGLVSGAYTYSKNLTDNWSDRSTAPQDSYNWHEGEYGPAQYDRTHVVSINYIYTVPFFRNAKGFERLALAGWELSGLASFYTGSPFTVTTSGVDPAGLGILGASPVSARPDMICNPNASAPKAYNGLTGPGQPTWFNTSCFAPVANGQVRPGNAGRGVVRGPGFANLDASAMKNFLLTEGGRLNFQLRGEFFNVTNHPNPNGFGSTNNTSTLFGEITSFRAPRIVQIAGKLIW